ncbi:hypothetical protein [Oricola sp.]|uniref:hypothetical protein n=1 Tax=Oricola sp. TaxID=1979950 RepID=UPI003BA91AAE
MKTAFRLTAIAVAAAPIGAAAHNGNHSHVEGGILQHMLTEATHLTAFAAIAAPVLLYAAVRALRPIIARLRG